MKQDINKYEQENKEFVKKNYDFLVKLNIPTFILEDVRKWIFFLQEGWEAEYQWDYAKEMSNIQLYRLVKNNKIESCLLEEIEARYHLKNKQILELKVVEENQESIRFNFFVNQIPLSQSLGIERFELAYCDFDFDILKATNHNRKVINKNSVARFLGDIEPENQFGTNRVVLYRCHCGCDYCGVVSFELEVQDNTVVWKDIRYETDDFDYELGLDKGGVKPIAALRFNKIEYTDEFKKYLRTNF